MIRHELAEIGGHTHHHRQQIVTHYLTSSVDRASTTGYGGVQLNKLRVVASDLGT